MILGEASRLSTVVIHERGRFVGGCKPEIEKEVRTDTIYPLLPDGVAGDVLVLEHDTGNMNGIGMEFRTRRDGVITRLKSGDSGNNEVERDAPSRGVFRSRNDRRIIASSQLKNFTEPQATFADDFEVLLLISVKGFHESLSLGIRSILGQRTKDLTASNSADVDIVTEDSAVSGGNRERYLGESRIKGFDTDDSIALVVQAKGTEETIYLQFSIRGPNTEMVTVLISNARSFNA